MEGRRGLYVPVSDEILSEAERLGVDAAAEAARAVEWAVGLARLREEERKKFREDARSLFDRFLAATTEEKLEEASRRLRQDLDYEFAKTPPADWADRIPERARLRRRLRRRVPCYHSSFKVTRLQRRAVDFVNLMLYLFNRRVPPRPFRPEE